MVRLSSLGVLIDPLAPTEVVGHQLRSTTGAPCSTISSASTPS
jgi:hypothetical protein